MKTTKNIRENIIRDNIVERFPLDQVSKSLGNYSQVTKIKPGASFYTFSGQVGADLEGQVPKDFKDQVDNTFLNIARLLEKFKLGPESVIKVNIWSTVEINWDYFDSVYTKFFSQPYPSMTTAYVSGLGTQDLKLEIEIWAAK